MSGVLDSYPVYRSGPATHRRATFCFDVSIGRGNLIHPKGLQEWKEQHSFAGNHLADVRWVLATGADSDLFLYWIMRTQRCPPGSGRGVRPTKSRYASSSCQQLGET